ncbi:alcohol dehydrogenase-like 2 [Panicum miliaceum]|uniref:Alcohol dehydrogenase-like 2 n=1 Tax=Panicum miliaceum TaxID=4540 RepID=A0A3L6T712_PANMI|nr:alcohol dehydrogenase-like 2 [Panicum miliaceum]
MEQNSVARPIRCKAAVCKAAGELLEMEEVEVAPPRAHEVRIKVVCTSICHSDITRMKDGSNMFPCILGHEAVGVVESVGEHVQEVAVGDTVVPVFLAQCGECADCRSAHSNLCSALPTRPGMPRDGTTRFSLAATGEPVHNFLSVSSFAEYTVVDVAHVVRVGTAIPPEKACLLSCGVAAGICAAWKVAAVEAGSTVAVFGLGDVGLAVAQGSKMRGAARIIGVDKNPDKFEIGKKLGVTDFVHPSDIGEQAVSEVIKEMTGGAGANYCFECIECIGSVSVMEEAVKSSRMVRHAFTGLREDGGGARRGRQRGAHSIPSVVRSYLGGIKPKDDIPVLAQKCLDKELELDEFITHQMRFDEINNRALDDLQLAEGRCLRYIIRMDGGVAMEDGA